MQRILSHQPEGRRVDTGGATAYAARQRQVSKWSVGLEMMRLSYGQGRLTPEDYFLLGAWQPGLSWRERSAFISDPVTSALNKSLNPPIDRTERQRTDNKLMTSSICSAAGLPQPKTRAVVAAQVPMGGYEWLDGPDAIKAYLRGPGALPGFGKPISGRAGQGAVSLMTLEGANHVRLGSGLVVRLDDLANEIWANFPAGFLFQELVRPHPALEALIGPVIGTLRIVTIDPGSGPEPLYVGLKAPAVEAMVDSGAGPLGGYAAVEAQSGRILRLQDRRQLGGTDLLQFPLSGAVVEGAELPDIAEALQLAIMAHLAIGDRGILGTDIFLSDRGYLLNEVNLNPAHSAFQIAFARGVLNDEFLPKLRAVRARFRDVTPSARLCPLP